MPDAGNAKTNPSQACDMSTSSPYEGAALCRLQWPVQSGIPSATAMSGMLFTASGLLPAF